MKRIAHLAAIGVSLVLFLLALSKPAETTVKIVPVKLTTAAIEPTLEATSTQSSTTAKKPPEVKIQPSRPVSDAELSKVANELSTALVNIYCDVRLVSGRRVVSGTGVLVSPQGAILTNAHLGQFFLFGDSKAVSCTIRKGNPAVAMYKAAITYVSPSWMEKNSDMLTKGTALGTGEHDIALLTVTEGIGAYTKPSAFPFVPLGDVIPRKNERLALMSYAAQYLTNTEIDSALHPTVALGAAQEVYTFSSTTPDVMTFAGSTIAQHGSSGGGVINAKGQLLGMITTSKTEGSFASRVVGAITASYIRREFAEETGSPIDLHLAAPSDVAVAAFASKVPGLRALIAPYVAAH
jgi:CBS domain-containing protein